MIPIYLNSMQCWVPIYDPHSGTFTWLLRGGGVITDLTNNLDDGWQWAARCMVDSLNDPNWLTLPDPGSATPHSLNSGINTVTGPFISSLQFSLTSDARFQNNWYKNSNVRKLGFARAVAGGLYQEQQWINAIDSEIVFEFPINDTVEITLAQGVSGSVTSYLWSGMPPTIANSNGAGNVPVPSGWRWFGPAPPS